MTDTSRSLVGLHAIREAHCSPAAQKIAERNAARAAVVDTADEAVLRLYEELARRTAERDEAVAMNTTQAETISNLLSYVADRVGPSATWGDYGQWVAAKDAIAAARATPSEEVPRG